MNESVRTITVYDDTKLVIDPNGRAFKNAKDMCRYWNRSYGTYKNRIHRGYTMEQALMTPTDQKITPHCTDHKGNGFPSESIMCRHYGINLGTYKNRKHKGWPLEKILTYESQKCETLDPLNRPFPSFTEMWRYYDMGAYNMPSKKNKTKEKITELIQKRFKKGETIGEITITGRSQFPYFLAEIDGKECIMHIDQILEHGRKTFQPQLEKCKGHKLEILQQLDNLCYLVLCDGTEKICSYWDILVMQIEWKWLNSSPLPAYRKKKAEQS